MARVKLEGKEHLLWKRVPCNPGKGTNASLRTVQRSKAKRCEAGPVSPCNPGKGTNASLRTGKVRQVQSLESTTGPGKVQRSKVKSVQGRPRGDVSKKEQGVKVDCYNTMRWIVATSWKESLEDHLKSCTVQPFPLESTSTVLG